MLHNKRTKVFIALIFAISWAMKNLIVLITSSDEQSIFNLEILIGSIYQHRLKCFVKVKTKNFSVCEQ